LKSKKTHRIIIAGGGTGGHVFPAIAIANELKASLGEVEILFVGATGKLEMVKVPEAGYEIIGLPISGFQRSLSIRNLMFPLRLVYSLVRSFFILMKFKPSVAIGVGGYASGPILYIASLMGIPTVVQEQNSYPGMTNKLLAKRASKICVAYNGMDKFFKPEKLVLTGNPVRKEILEASMDREEAKGYFGLDTSKPLILAIGGSLGARTINESLFSGLDTLYHHSYQLLWQCGQLYYGEFSKQINQSVHPNVQLVEFIKKMDIAYAAADIIISRAGALSISELCLIGKPVILVPSPNVAEDHQTKNAQALESVGAAMMVADVESRKSLVTTAIQLLEDEEKMEALADAIKLLAAPDATKRIGNEIEALIK
jgi:UDP-N-acetylglucosamine--N-acetylmuramyl-(pentapeptide) pyrophosphoryl-undecaprenol N-acetylglucosamine transferase